MYVFYTHRKLHAHVRVFSMCVDLLNINLLRIFRKVVYDYKCWLEPHLSPNIKFMSVPHQFQIRLHARKACVTSKHFSSSPRWRPELPADPEIPIRPEDFACASVHLPVDESGTYTHIDNNICVAASVTFILDGRLFLGSRAGKMVRIPST